MALLRAVRIWRSKFQGFRKAKRASESGIAHPDRQQQDEDGEQNQENLGQQPSKERDQEPIEEDDDLRLPPGCSIAEHLFLSSGWPEDPDRDRHPGEAVNYIVYPRQVIDDAGNQRAYEQMAAIVGTRRILERSRRKNPNVSKEVFMWWVMLAEEEVPRVRAIPEVNAPENPEALWS